MEGVERVEDLVYAVFFNYADGVVNVPRPVFDDFNECGNDAVFKVNHAYV